MYSVGNVLLFVPLGAVAPMLFNRLRRLSRALLLGFACPLIIELAQATYLARSETVDDLVFNTLGAGNGFACFSLLRLVDDKIPFVAAFLDTDIH